jgi:tetratricopeptide (TPR) repeat protein
MRDGITSGRLIAAILLAILSPLLFAHSQTASPREQLRQYVADLQKSPDDQQLRERIIKLAQELKPAPAIPEEARRHYVKADALIHDAKSPEEAAPAVEEYNKALLEAPWWPDVYRDLGVALELAGRYDEAKKTLKLYLLSHPAEDESRKAQDEIYRIEAKEDSAARKQREVEAAKTRAASETAKQQSLEGTWVGAPGVGRERHCPGEPPARFSIARRAGGGELAVRLLSLCQPASLCLLQTQNIAGKNVKFVTADNRNTWVHKYDLTLSADGTMLTGPHQYYFKGEYMEYSPDDVFCRQE